jgi:large subunit ribosomal protein L10
VDRSQKEEMVVQLKQLFQEQTLVVVTHYSGLTVADMTEFRGKMREAGAHYKVTKNRLSRLALDDMDFKELGELFMGPIGLAYSEDPVAAAKVTVEFAKKNKNLVVLGGVFNGQILDVAAVDNLAKLPSLDALRAGLVGMIQTPATRIACIMQAPAGQVARVIGAYSEKEEAA